MIPVEPRLPETREENWKDSLTRKLRDLFVSHASEINRKTGSVSEDPAFWMLRGKGSSGAVGASGNLIRLAQVVTSGSQATVDFSSIPATYSAIKVLYSSADTHSGTASSLLRLMINGDGTAANYGISWYSGIQNGSGLNSFIAGSTTGAFVNGNPQAGNNANVVATGEITLINYAGATHKRINATLFFEDQTSNVSALTLNARYQSTSAINQLTFTTDGTAIRDGSVFTLYGLT